MVSDVATGLPTTTAGGRAKDPERMLAWVPLTPSNIRRRVPSCEARNRLVPRLQTVTAGNPVATVGGNLLSVPREHKHPRRHRWVTVCMGYASASTEMHES